MNRLRITLCLMCLAALAAEDHSDCQSAVNAVVGNAAIVTERISATSIGAVAASKVGRLQRFRLYRTSNDRLIRVNESLEGLALDRLRTVESAMAAGDQIVVSFRPGTAREDIDALAQRMLGAVSRWNPKLQMAVIRLGGRDDSTEEALATAKADAHVVNAMHDGIITASRVPNDPYYRLQDEMAQIAAPLAWDITTGSGLTVAVIDSGVQTDHPDLGSFTAGWDWVDDDNDPTDTHGHGTHIAGIIGARPFNGRGVAGVCWNVRIMPLRVLNGSNYGYYSDFAAAMVYAVDNGATILNLSLGGGYYGSEVLQTAVDYVTASGGLMVICAGNDGSTWVQYPGACTSPNIICVGASQGSALASYSNHHPNLVDLVAPGNAWSTLVGSAYTSMSGTSMSTAYVSGACALLKSYRSTLTATQIRDAILGGVDVMPTFADTCATSGRLNIMRSLELLGATRFPNRAPYFTTTQREFTFPEDDQYINMWFTAVDDDGDSLTWDIPNQLTHSEVTITRNDMLHSYCRFIPQPNFNGVDAFDLRISDGHGLSSTIHIDVTLEARRDAPVCTTAPSVAGTPVVGEALIADPGLWNDDVDVQFGGTSNITFTWQWERAAPESPEYASEMYGDTAQTYIIPETMQGFLVRCRVTAVDSGVGTSAGGWPIAVDTVGYAVSPWIAIPAAPPPPPPPPPPPVTATTSSDGGGGGCGTGALGGYCVLLGILGTLQFLRRKSTAQ